jgi:nucleoid DNA-binding protein
LAPQKRFVLIEALHTESITDRPEGESYRGDIAASKVPKFVAGKALKQAVK